MVTALRPIEVRTAAAGAVPKVAAVLAEAFVNDPVFTWLLPGNLRLHAILRTMFAAEIEQCVLPNGGTVWTTSGYDGAVSALPPGSWEMPRSFTGREALKGVRAERLLKPHERHQLVVVRLRRLEVPHAESKMSEHARASPATHSPAAEYPRTNTSVPQTRCVSLARA
jgi:hypothetical protein